MTNFKNQSSFYLRTLLHCSLVLGLMITSLEAQTTEYYGALHSVMKGNIIANFDLRELENKTHVYGIGAVENLKGEIIVIDSVPYISSVDDSSLLISKKLDTKAALFVYKEVAQWQEIKPDSIPVSLSDLEKELGQLFETGQHQKLQPVVFMLKGWVKSLSWHVIDWPAADSIHTHKKHKEAGLHGKIEDRDVTIVGFYTNNHQGIITHRNSTLHLHFVTEDKKLAGHVDNLYLDADMNFYTEAE